MLLAFGQARIGRDVEIRKTPSGESVANVSLAFNYGRKGQDGKYPSQWVEGVMWGKTAETLAQYLTKGTTVTVSLEDVHTESYQNTRDNTTGTKLVGRIQSINLGARPSDPAAAPPPPARAPAPAPRPPAAAPSGFADMDDDIPF